MFQNPSVFATAWIPASLCWASCSTHLLEDFATTLGQVKSHGKVDVPRSDCLNVAKITSNLVHVGGNAKAGALAETAYLLTTLAFGKGASAQSQVEPYFFSFVEARETPEHGMDTGAAPIAARSGSEERSASAASTSSLPSVSKPEDVAQTQTTSQAAPAPAPTPLFEPSIMGDAPAASDEESSGFAGGAGAEGSGISVADPELAQKYSVLEAELTQHKELAEALASDVKRLMKERREPLTNADLRESMKEMEARLKHLQEQNKKFTEMISQKESQIELLKAQVDRLKVNAA